MKKIKFSHCYSKIPSISPDGIPKAVRLIQVFETDFKELSEDLREYDCGYMDRGKKYYKLPKSGKCLVLLFYTHGMIFTTIRPAFPSRKIEYYKNAVGEMFEIKITPHSHD